MEWGQSTEEMEGLLDDMKIGRVTQQLVQTALINAIIVAGL